MRLARLSALPGGPATHSIDNPVAWLFMKPATRRSFSKAAPWGPKSQIDPELRPLFGSMVRRIESLPLPAG